MLVSALQALEAATRGAANRPLARRLCDIRTALQHRSLHAALKLIDRAWRTMPDAAATLAPLYGRLLLIGDHDPDAALRVLSRVETLDADVAALTAHAYFRLRRADDARRTLDAALRTYSVAPQGLLAREASAALQVPELHAAGWIGLGPSLEFVGELAPGHSADFLDVRVGAKVVEHAVRVIEQDGRVQFGFPPPRATAGETLTISSGGSELLGSGHRLPLDFALDGRTEGDGRRVSGWARIGWLPAHRVRLRLQDDRGDVVLANTRSVPLQGYRWSFGLNLRGSGLRGSRISVQARLPDGRWQPLPDTPLLLPRAVCRRPARLPRWRKRIPPLPSVSMTQALSVVNPAPTPIDIIIPVYRGLRETLACIDSALSTAGKQTRLIVVDDATAETTLAAALDDLAAAGRVTLLRNERNQGFVRSVNRALAVSSGRDVVLLNADTLVFDDWLQRLRAAAYRDRRVGTVTPLSNDGSIASYPRRFGGAIDADEAAALHKLAARTHTGLSAEIPVGVGFCLYIRRDCLTEVGELDAAAFGIGYGEESDFCLRAREHGWSHRVAADVFVYHAGGGSFGPRRAALLERSQRLLNLRYPGYDRYVTEFLKHDQLLPLRRKLDERRLAAFEGRFVLLVSLALEGGVERFVAERKQELHAQGFFTLVLRPHRTGDTRRCELSTDAIEAPNLLYTVPADLAELSGLLSQLRLERIEIHHFLDLDPAVINAVRALGVPYDVMIHDYAWICPRITLIDGSGRYCGEPAVAKCESCLRTNGSRLRKVTSVASLRARSAAWLANARAILAPSSDAAARLKRYFPDIEIMVRPHSVAANAPLQAPLSAARANGAQSPHRLRVGLIGAIGAHKGYRILRECARDAAARQLPLEFVVIGYTENDGPLLRTGRVEVTGRYVDAEVAHLLRREQPDLVFLPSVWPETWCYALDHALSAGLPIVAFDIGAIAERLRAAGRQSLLPLGFDARQINDRLLQLGAHRNAEPYVQTSLPDHSDVTNIEKGRGTRSMKPSDSGLTQDEALSASLQVLPLLPGLYLFSVKSATPAADRGSGVLRVPAMHVGLGPGVRSDQVEFVAGPSTEGAWLFARGDVLVARVNGAGATLVLTSVRAPSGDVLSIEVERLESRLQMVQAPAVAEQPVEQVPDVTAREPNAPLLATPMGPVAEDAAEEGTISLQIKTHIRARGDMNFSGAPWAGRVAPGLWVESFSVQPLQHLSAHDVEYKGLTGTGFETPWQSDGQNCGTKGMSVPLVGFAVRLRPSAETAPYDCEYSGYFQSGTIVGPLRNGAPCRSTVANDPLEGVQIRLVKRANAQVTSMKSAQVRASTGAVRTAIDTPVHGQRKSETGAAGRVVEGNRSAKRTKTEGQLAR